MKDITDKALSLLPEIKHYKNANVFFDPSIYNPVSKADIHGNHGVRFFPEGEVIAILQAKDNTLSIKQLIFSKADLELVKVQVHNDLVMYYLSVNPDDEYKYLSYENLRTASKLNDFDNDQQIAAVLRELQIKTENIFITHELAN